MNTTWQGFDGFLRSLRHCASDESSLSIGRVKAVGPVGQEPQWLVFLLIDIQT